MATGRRRESGSGRRRPSTTRKRDIAPSGPRALAIEAVRRVTDEGAYSNRLIPSLLDRSKLPPGDRELANELAYGTLRRLPVLDAAIEPLLERALRRAPAWSRAALRVGAYQLLHTRVPAHAAVSETVGASPPRQRGFVNAVLRRLAASPSMPDVSPVAPWILEELRVLLGDEAEAAADALAEPAGLTLRANPCGDVADLEAILRSAGIEGEPGRVHPGSLRLRGGDPRTLPGWQEGGFAVQDEASAWVVDVLDPRPGERVLDCCAGPGGKAADIACRAGGVVASDLSDRRTALVGRGAERLGVAAKLLVQDARFPALRPGFDRVLVDAPCSGIGTARRRPELLWRPDAEDPARLQDLQVAITVASAELLRPGGVLVYSVCTFPRAETDGVLERVLAEGPDLALDPFEAPGGEQGGTARLWPHRDGTDAMFAARLVRGG